MEKTTENLLMVEKIPSQVVFDGNIQNLRK